MSGGGKGRRRGHEEEEHENHERWAVSYADMVTVLMCLFIVLFAISQVDKTKFIQLAKGLANGFGASSSTPLPGGQGLLNTSGQTPNPAQIDLQTGAGPQQVAVSINSDQLEKARNVRSKATAQANLDQAKEELDRLLQIKGSLQSSLTKKGLQNMVRFRITERGLVAALVSDDVFFKSADATIQPKGRQVLNVLAPALAPLKESVSVEGNTNQLAVSPGNRYRDNWELSAARAAAVVSDLVENHHLAPKRMIVTGYGSIRPLYPATDSRAVVGNRRVDIVVLDSKPTAVRALIPQLAEARGENTKDSSTSQSNGN